MSGLGAWPRSRRLLCALATLVLIAMSGCGDNRGNGGGDGNGGGTDASEQDGPNGQTQTSGDEGGESGTQGQGGDGEAVEAAITTELDLGQAFAQEPAFDADLGPVAVDARADRGGGQTLKSRPPIHFRLTNTSSAPLADASVQIRFTVQPPVDPEDPPVPGEGDRPLALSPRTTQGTCREQGAPAQSTVTCELGTLEAQGEAMVSVTSPEWFRYAIAMTLTASR